MNNKLFWKARKLLLLVIFKLKSWLYRVFDFISGNREYSSFKALIIKSTLIFILRNALIITIVLWADGVVQSKIRDIIEIDNDIFIPTIIGGIGFAGVILGLYCANITSIYSSRYTNAPHNIAHAFQYDSLSRKCISGIVDYIVYCFLTILAIMMKTQISWVIVIVFMLRSITVVISYSIAGNRAYQLSDVYEVAADSYRILYRIITKRINQSIFANDADFQNHFLKLAEKQIRLLKSIQKYGSGISKNENTENSAMTEFMGYNLALIKSYWISKRKISRSSLWYRNTPKYPRWHLIGDVELSLALKTGTSLKSKDEHNYWWFEEELMAINKSCLSRFFEVQDYLSIYEYMAAFEQLCSTAIEYKEANFYVSHVDWIKKAIEKSVISIDLEGNRKNAFTGVIDILSLLYLDLILESGKVYQNFELDGIVSRIVEGIDSGLDVEKNELTRGREDIDFYKKIVTEVQVEGKRITPDWVIKQQVAKEEYTYLNSLLDIIREGMNHAFSLGKLLAEKKLYSEACVILIRFYEYESKLSRFVSIIESRKDELMGAQIDKAVKWDDFRLEKLLAAKEEWRKSVPTLLFECASHFALDNWENREEYPDFLGECYNHICEDAVGAIVEDDISQFEIDYQNLSKIMLLYQEYIRSDFVKHKDLYRVEYAYYVFTSPIVEWAQIGGLAILWGEFYSNEEWKRCVSDSSSFILKNGGNDLAERLIKYTKDRKRFIIGIASRDILETDWSQNVANTIRESGICEIENDLFNYRLKTDSRLLKAFCPEFTDMGFTNDPSEVFWVTCVNPFVSADKKFHTRYSWEDNLND